MSVHVEFAVVKVAPGRVFLGILRFSPVSIIPPLFHHIHSCVTWWLDNGPVSDGSSIEIVSLRCNNNNIVGIFGSNVPYPTSGRSLLVSENRVLSRVTSSETGGEETYTAAEFSPSSLVFFF